jgi:hypothetical protein
MLVAVPTVFIRLYEAVATRLVTLAVTVYDPTVVPAVKLGAVATPAELVTAVVVREPEKLPLVPEAGAANVTTTPARGSPFWSSTVACNAVEKAAPTTALWDEPLEAVMLEAMPLTFMRLYKAGVATLATLAVTVKGPVIASAVNAGAVAIPEVFVISVTEVRPPAKLPLAPFPGAAKVTMTPAIGLPYGSSTVAWSVEKAVLIAALCGVPAVARTLVTEPTIFVRLYEAEVATPRTLEVTTYVPEVVPAVKTGAVATPARLVVAVMVREPEKLPPAPEVGAAKVTTIPETGLPY